MVIIPAYIISVQYSMAEAIAEAIVVVVAVVAVMFRVLPSDRVSYAVCFLGYCHMINLISLFIGISSKRPRTEGIMILLFLFEAFFITSFLFLGTLSEVTAQTKRQIAGILRLFFPPLLLHSFTNQQYLEAS
jgi:hypothetical protein